LKTSHPIHQKDVFFFGWVLIDEVNGGWVILGLFVNDYLAWFLSGSMIYGVRSSARSIFHSPATASTPSPPSAMTFFLAIIAFYHMNFFFEVGIY
jgi:hypothetical protein